ncbi:MAG TPA: multicopper oxidase domain-containing protein [Anaerotruncus colihominis]|nr:multicopper oxidase domain-containing protein [Anaerotruncus colihominis]
MNKAAVPHPAHAHPQSFDASARRRAYPSDNRPAPFQAQAAHNPQTWDTVRLQESANCLSPPR